MRRWKYWEHVTRMSEGRFPHDLWCWAPPGIRKSGRQRSTLGRSLEKEATSLRATLNELWSLAQDRSSCMSTVAALCAPRRKRISVHFHRLCSNFFHGQAQIRLFDNLDSQSVFHRVQRHPQNYPKV
ncbi:uncharacterized protein LOC136034145 [Artemia franciscana]|uniref:uncharacterized protein LOC136034145 n=1 Tax=Artemia franciscana TaxID=6661 RepID=UPI0032DBCD83